jgi:hypothetical protein
MNISEWDGDLEMFTYSVSYFSRMSDNASGSMMSDAWKYLMDHEKVIDVSFWITRGRVAHK